MWRLLAEVGSALEYMHEHVGLLHLDVKPHNIFVRRDRSFCLGDFGNTIPIVRIARAHTREKDPTHYWLTRVAQGGHARGRRRRWSLPERRAASALHRL